MDIFKFMNPNHPTKMEQGEIVNGVKSKMWVERFNKAGDFTLTAPVSSGLRESLPIDSFISHINTTEIMIVENHEITEDQGKEPDIVITGRTVETFLENRIVGSNNPFPGGSEPLTEYVLAEDNVITQAVVLINDHIADTSVYDPSGDLPYIYAYAGTLPAEIGLERAIKRGTVYERLLELLSEDPYTALGIKSIRPSVNSPVGFDSSVTLLYVYPGFLRPVTISYSSNELLNADYLWSSRKLKNAALVSGKWVETIINGSETGIKKRMMLIDGSDIDQAFEEVPTGDDLLAVVNAMQLLGNQVLQNQNNIVLSKPQLLINDTQSKYRVDYQLGDVIQVIGDYNENAVMRVTEYVEFEDSTGEGGYPTLTVDPFGSLDGF